MVLSECINRDIEGGCIPECKTCTNCIGKPHRLIDKELLKEKVHEFVDKQHTLCNVSDSELDVIADTAMRIIDIINEQYTYTLYDKYSKAGILYER